MSPIHHVAGRDHRESRSEMDVIVWSVLSKWIKEEWPFQNPHYAPR